MNNYLILLIKLIPILITISSCTNSESKEKSLNNEFSGLNLLDTSLSYSAIEIPQTNNKPIDFEVLPPGIVLIPLSGGIYLPQFKEWYLEPDSFNIQSISADLKTSSLYYLKDYPKLSMIYKVSKLKNDEISVQITDTLKRGFYKVDVTGDNSYYIFGLNNNGYHIWKRKSKNEKKLLMKTSQQISAFTYINNNNFIACIENKIVLFSNKRKPLVIAKNDKIVDGIAVSNEGDIFISMGNIIYKINSSSGYTPIFTGAHGPLNYFNKTLYILSNERNKIIAINL